MVVEKFTESLTLEEMGCMIGETEFGYVFPQGDVGAIDKLEEVLKKAGGKPKECDIEDYETVGNGKGRPEFIMTFNDELDTILVIECKSNISKHKSDKLNRPRDFAVDGALYYAKHLSTQYNVIAIAVSGTKKEKMKVDSYFWPMNQKTFFQLSKATDTLLPPTDYLKLIRGERLQREYSLADIRQTALEMHETLRQIKVSEKHKPIFIAGILIALENKEFSDEYPGCKSFSSVIKKLNSAIEEVLRDSDIKKDKIDYIKSAFRIIGSNEKLKNIPLGHRNSITWYIEQLDLKIKPMMNHADSTIDSLSVFYHEFVKYSGGDGSGLGIVLTPQHLTEFMCDILNINKNSRVVDICCGSGAFLVTAMSKMIKNATSVKEITEIKRNGLYGVELDVDLFTLAITNMIVRRDGKSNIYHGDCFNDIISSELEEKKINIGLMNPPYSQDDYSELEFVEKLLSILVPGGQAAVVVPMSCAIGTKFKEERERLLKNNTLKAVFSMPDDIFTSGTNVCVMIWEAHTPHDVSQETFFGYYKIDGFEKRKKIGRVDVNNRWDSIKAEWLSLYRNKDVKPGLSAKKCITSDDEWLCEAYMETDYSTLVKGSFQETVNNYYSYIVKKSANKTIDRFDIDDWKVYNLVGSKGLFDFERGKRLTKSERIPGNTPLVTAGFIDEGVAEYISNTEMKEYSNCLTIDMFGNCYYRGYNFHCDDNIIVLKCKEEISKFAYLFISTVISQEKYRCSYGRQYRQKDLKKHKIILPSKNGSPDWIYMEDTIKTLQYAEKI